MLKMRVFVIALALMVFAAVPKAYATDPCDPAVMDQMSQSASAAFNRLSDIGVTLLKPPSPAASSNCLRSLFNIWKIDPAMLLGSIFPTGTLGYTIAGFTLTQSSPAALVLTLVQNYFNSAFGNMICGELWSNIGEALRPIKFNPDGSINIGSSLAGSISGISGLGTIFNIMQGGTAQIKFPGGFTGSITVAP